MQRCSHCQSHQIDGTIFCTECGASLIVLKQPSTTSSIGASAQPTSSSAFAPDISAATNETRLSLTIIATGRQLQLPVAAAQLIGRRDDVRGVVPDVDLGGDGGYDSGVSRRHAMLTRRDDEYYVEDLGSANGTFINEQQLAPQHVTRLANGDELRCGLLALRVEISP